MTHTTETTSGRAMNVCRLCNSIGLPATQRNCLSSLPPVLVLSPAATITTPTSRFTPENLGKEVAEQVSNRADRYDAVGLARRAAFRDENPAHSHVLRFRDSPL